jgi:hypothetical protein
MSIGWTWWRTNGFKGTLLSDKPMWGLKAIYGLGLCRFITSYNWSNSPQVIALVPSVPPGSRHLPTPPTRQAEDWCSACRRTWPPHKVRPNSRNRPGHLKSYRPGHGKNGPICFFQIKLVDHLSWTILDPVAIICGYLHHITSSFPDQCWILSFQFWLLTRSEKHLL